MIRKQKRKIKQVGNLNRYSLESDGNYDVNFTDNSVIGDKRKIQVFFRNIKEHLIKEINKADAVIGCVAWLTDSDILNALSKKANVCIIVQKEDFLRPDSGVNIRKLNWQTKWKKKLKKMYDGLHCNLERTIFSNILSSVTTNQITTYLDSVRCVGHYNKSRRAALMHNKFLIFAKYYDSNEKGGEVYDYSKVRILPYAVWTGSFNFTKNASKSLENAILIRNKEIVNAYFVEFGQICAMSETLDWTSRWVAPQWRIGT